MPFSVTDVDAIFAAAIELSSPDERAEYVQRVCGESAELRQRVDELLAAHFAAGDFLEPPNATVLYRDDDVQAGPGTVIGPYKLLQQIGEGGMGVVFMAEQSEPIQRTVALKIIKPGMDTRQVIARFEAERQALAMMDHPNIAKVLDAGTTDTGRPYFVMELVKGVPITKYCDEKQLTLRERLELIKPVCEAVQHAHQKGIIHRDLKPTNVLVAEYDNRAVPKVIDFGVAKATAQKLTERTMFTEFGQVIGTVEYMSPEQAKFNQLDIDTRSDIYSLGVLLYELLAGSPPFEQKRLREAAFDEVLRIIREEEPPKPSARLSTSETLPSIAANRHTEPARLSRDVSGELDWIVMKCLEKDRNRRYETASGLAGDIDRYLQDEPVHACPPSSVYRFRKFVRRNKVAVAFVLFLVAAVAALVVSNIQTRRNEQRAIIENARATTISDLLQRMFGSSNPDEAKGRDYTVRQLLDEFSANLSDELAGHPEVEAEIRATIGQAYRNLGLPDRAEPHLSAALELRQRTYGAQSVQVARSLGDYAWNFCEQGDCVGAEQQCRKALAIHAKLGLQDNDTVKLLGDLHLFVDQQRMYKEAKAIADEALAIAHKQPEQPPVVADILHRLAAAEIDQGNFDKGEQLAKKSVAMHRTVHGENHPETAWSLEILGSALIRQRKTTEAEIALREALAIFRRHYGGNHKSVVLTIASLQQVYRAQGDDAALKALRAQQLEDARAITDDTIDVWLARAQALARLGEWKQANDILQLILPEAAKHTSLLADCYKSLGLLKRNSKEWKESEAMYREALKLKSHDPDAHNGLGNALMFQERWQDAEAEHRAALKRSNFTGYRFNLATDLAGQKRFGEAAWELREIKRVVPNDFETRYAIGNVLSADGKLAEAEAEYREAIQLKPDLPSAYVELGKILKNYEDAAPRFTKAIELNPKSSIPYFHRGVNEYRSGKWQDAIKSFETSSELSTGGAAHDWFYLAMAHQQLGHKDEAGPWYDKAVEWMDQNQSKSEVLLHLRAEAAEQLSITKPKPELKSAPPTEESAKAENSTTTSSPTTDN